MDRTCEALQPGVRLATADPLDTLARRAGALLATVAEWSARARQRRELLALDEHMLADIGISRGEALAEGRKPFWRD